MPKVQKGPKAAADILNNLNPDEQKRILDEIAESDPAVAKEIIEQLVTLDSLQFITAKMLSDLLKELKPDILALALRTADVATARHVLTLLPKSIAQEMQQIISGQPHPKAKVFEAVQLSLQIMRRMISKGLLVLKQGGDIMV